MADKQLSRRDFLRGAAAAGLMATGSLLGITKAEAEEVPAAYLPGTYSASAVGMGGDVTVTITVDESSILDVVIDATNVMEVTLPANCGLVSTAASVAGNFRPRSAWYSVPPKSQSAPLVLSRKSTAKARSMSRSTARASRSARSK